MSHENVEIVQGIYKEMARGNFWALAPFLDPQVEWFWPPELRSIVGREVYRGREGVEEATRDWFQAWEHYTLDAEDLVDAGDSVVVLSHGRGRAKLGGADVEARGAEVWTFRDGKIMRMQGYGDRPEALEAAGLSEHRR